VPVGAHYVPVEGPDWPWRTGAASFDRAFAAMADAGLDTVRIDLLWSALEPAPGQYDADHLAVLDEVLEAARRHGLFLHPVLFVGGEVGDAYWDIPWRAGRHPHRDADLVELAVAHARELGHRWRSDPAIVAWDLADEPPHWLFRDTTDDEARAWTASLCAGLRAVDPDHLITVGTASQEIGAGAFRADVVADLLDVATVHPYPTYEPGLYPDGLLSPRMTHAAAFETALSAGAGRPVWVHEYGVSSAQFDPTLAGHYDRLLAWSAFGRGAIGFLAWCWTDAEPAAYARAPYVRQPHETQFGVTDHEGGLRPRGRVLAELAATMDSLGDDLDGLAGDGPVSAAAIPVPHEFVRPYDRAAYGLAEGASGPYEPAERIWDPERDPTPLIRGWLNAFVLAARAGVSVGFERERLDDRWPDAPLVIVPSPLTSTSSSLLHVRTSFWRGAAAHAAAGRAAWLSVSGDAALPGMAELAGCHLADRVPGGRPGHPPLRPCLGSVQRGRRARARRRRRVAGDAVGTPRARRWRDRGHGCGRGPRACRGTTRPGGGRHVRRARRAAVCRSAGCAPFHGPDLGPVRRAACGSRDPRAGVRGSSRRDVRQPPRVARRSRVGHRTTRGPTFGSTSACHRAQATFEASDRRA
jgi:hypothetical protein